MFKVHTHARNVHEIEFFEHEGNIAMLSDLHWDNPHCDRELLKRHLDYFKTNNIPVMINGDFFCLMQGRGDNRRNKSEIRPEHNNARYLDSIVETAVDWFAPYADILTIIGYGNHETGVIKYQETDVLQRFVDLLNYKCNSNVQTGGYGGWIIAKLQEQNIRSAFNIKYMHGSGGGGVVTKGALNLTRAMEIYENYDVFTMGHIHENSARNDVRDTIHCNAKMGYEVKHRHLHNMITGTYKEEYNDGASGWHVERGAPVKPLGGRILKLKVTRERIDDTRRIQKYIDSTQIFV